MSDDSLTGGNVATTDSSIVYRVLNILECSGIEYAILNGAEELEEGTLTSDLDVATNVDIGVILDRCLAEFNRVGIYILYIWPYDYECASVFAIAANLGGVAHFDVSWGTGSRDILGINRRVVVETCYRDSGGLARACPSVQLAYLYRKRLLKGQLRAAEAMADDVSKSAQSGVVKDVIPQVRLRAHPRKSYGSVGVYRRVLRLRRQIIRMLRPARLQLRVVTDGTRSSEEVALQFKALVLAGLPEARSEPTEPSRRHGALIGYFAWLIRKALTRRAGGITVRIDPRRGAHRKYQYGNEAVIHVDAEPGVNIARSVQGAALRNFMGTL